MVSIFSVIWISLVMLTAKREQKLGFIHVFYKKQPSGQNRQKTERVSEGVRFY